MPKSIILISKGLNIIRGIDMLQLLKDVKHHITTLKHYYKLKRIRKSFKFANTQESVIMYHGLMISFLTYSKGVQLARWKVPPCPITSDDLTLIKTIVESKTENLTPCTLDQPDFQMNYKIGAAVLIVTFMLYEIFMWVPE